MSEYIAKLKSEGKKVYYPGTDTNQLDSIGYRICDDNRKAIEESREVHIYFDGKSTGSFFDLGMSFALKKRLYIVNKSEYVMTKTKSFENITTEWDRISCKPRDTQVKGRKPKKINNDLRAEVATSTGYKGSSSYFLVDRRSGIQSLCLLIYLLYK